MIFFTFLVEVLQQEVLIYMSLYNFLIVCNVQLHMNYNLFLTYHSLL